MVVTKHSEYEVSGAESPETLGMTEELLTSRYESSFSLELPCAPCSCFRFGSNESVCKPYTVRTVVHHQGRGRRGQGEGGEGKLEQIRRSITKILGKAP